MTSDWQKLSIQLHTMIVFRSLVQSEVLSKLSAFFRSLSLDTECRVSAYCDFVSALYENDWNLSRCLLSAAVADENAYVRLLSKDAPIPAVLQQCVDNELALLGQLAGLTSQQLSAATGYDGPLPGFETSELDFPTEYMAGIAQIHKNGYGIYADHVMFGVRDGQIVPAPSADPITVGHLVGYELQRQQVIDNTRALVKGLPAANVLLYGDAGTGKSSTVKAVTNLFASEGVRLIELRKDQLQDIPSVMDQLKDNPLKFILFIDDLSFQSNDDSYGTMKAILEGSACARTPNVVIYATSNRRHLVKESFNDREGSDDIHRRDTIQEVMSLSERFGLTVLFSTPNKSLYLEIVRGLAEEKGIDLPQEELERRAEVFALEKGGRSARAAEQFTNSLLAHSTGKE